MGCSGKMITKDGKIRIILISRLNNIKIKK